MYVYIYMYIYIYICIYTVTSIRDGGRVAILLPILPNVMEGSFHPSKEGFLEGYGRIWKDVESIVLDANTFYMKVFTFIFVD